MKSRNDFIDSNFLGDDDLLEIKGNSGELGKVLTTLVKCSLALLEQDVRPR
jgi:hypothetical protein